MSLFDRLLEDSPAVIAAKAAQAEEQVVVHHVDVSDVPPEQVESLLARVKTTLTESAPADLELAEDKDVGKAQKELLHLIGMLRTLALKHTKRLVWAGGHGEKYQDAARDAKRGLQQMAQQLGYLH